MEDWIPLLIYFAIGFSVGYIVTRMAKYLFWIIAAVSVASIILPQLGVPIQVDPETLIGRLVNAVSVLASVLQRYWTGPLGLLIGAAVGLWSLARR